MSTRSNIGIQNADGSITAIYCHFDGHRDGVGDKLLAHYTDEAKIRALIALGDISCLGAELGEKHNFDDPRMEGWTRAYGRDRGEEGIEAHDCTDDMHFCSVARKNYGAEYAYLWKDGKWLCWELYGGDFKPIDLYSPAPEEVEED